MPRPGERVPLTTRLKAQMVVNEDGCWIWTGMPAKGGYGRIEIRDGVGRGTRRFRAVHRVSYEAFVGPIPAGLDIDHTCHSFDLTCSGGETCRHRKCINPSHLEAVTERENALRGRSDAAANAVKTHCPQGHPYDDANTYRKAGANPQRCCRACRAIAERKRVRVRKQPGSAA